MKILLVERDNQLLSSIQRLLLENGFQVEAISDADTGWDFAMLGAYDLLILDIGTSGTTGHMLTRQVRANRCTVPIIILTHKNSVEERVESLNSGADFCLGIPFDNRELIHIVSYSLKIIPLPKFGFLACGVYLVSFYSFLNRLVSVALYIYLNITYVLA